MGGSRVDRRHGRRSDRQIGRDDEVRRIEQIARAFAEVADEMEVIRGQADSHPAAAVERLDPLAGGGAGLCDEGLAIGFGAHGWRGIDDDDKVAIIGFAEPQASGSEHGGDQGEQHQQQRQRIPQPLEERRGFALFKDFLPQEKRRDRAAARANLEEINGDERNGGEQAPKELRCEKTHEASPPFRRIDRTTSSKGTVFAVRLKPIARWAHSACSASFHSATALA